jgi:hypothetical protein
MKKLHADPDTVLEGALMLKLFCRLSIAGAVLSLPLLGAAPARTSSLATFVSGKGTDTGTCASPAAPCRSSKFALGQTSPGGEIKALDPADYGAVTITKSISLTGVEGAGINSASGDHITINAGPDDTINLSHLTLDGFKTAGNGIALNSGGPLTITHCIVRNFASQGIRLLPTGLTKFLIGDTLVSDNLGTAIAIAPQGAGSTQGTLDHVSANKNGQGITVTGFATSGVPIDVPVVDSMVTDNSIGFGVGPRGLLRLAGSAAARNNTGVFINTGATVESAIDNFIGNDTDVSGKLTDFRTR